MKYDLIQENLNKPADGIISFIADRGRDKAIQARENVLERIIKHPARSIGIAAAVGCVAGFLLKKR